MTDKLVTARKYPWALVRVQGNGQPGRRPPTSVAWLEWDGGDHFLGHLLFAHRSGAWARSYKHTKKIKKSDVLHIFQILKVHQPSLASVRAAKLALPLIPADAA